MPGKITIDWTKCSGIGICAEVCPVGVWDVEEAADFNNERKGYPNRPEDCIQCMACADSCPSQAITIEDSETGEAVYIKK